MSDTLAERMVERAERALSAMGGPDPLLSRLAGIRAAIDRARTLADVGALLDDIERLKRYARTAKWTLDQQNAIARVWFLAQRRGGVLLGPDGIERQRTGGDRRSSSKTSTMIAPSLPDLGIRRDQSSIWQRYAKMAEPKFEAMLDEIAEARRLTATALIPYMERAEGTFTRPAVTLAGAEDGRAAVYAADWRALLGTVEDESVDLLLTDPPYSTDVEDVAAFAADWLPTALAKVRRSGRAYVFIGAYPRELLAYLEVMHAQDRLIPEQVLAWTYKNTMGPAPTHVYKLNWQAVLYLRGPEAPPLDCPLLTEHFSVMEVSAPGGARTPRAHPWQKPDALAERLVRHATAEGASVLDPFAGTGAFVAAAARLGRRAVGGEVDPAMLDWCAARGLEVVRAAR